MGIGKADVPNLDCKLKEDQDIINNITHEKDFRSNRQKTEI